MDYLIIRHTQSVANVDPTIYRTICDTAVPLTEIGRDQAAAVGERVEDFLEGSRYDNLVFWRSPYQRAVETSGYIHTGFMRIDSRMVKRPWIDDVCLIEQRFGYFDGLSTKERVAIYPQYHERVGISNACGDGWFYEPYPAGESRFDCVMRARLFFSQDEFRDPDNTCHIIVTHGVMSRALIMDRLRLPVKWMQGSANPKNGSIQLIENGELTTYFEGF